MTAKLQKFVNNIFITIERTINITKNFEWEASVVGFEYFGLYYLAGFLSGQKSHLAYCRQEAKITPPGCDWDKRGMDR